MSGEYRQCREALLRMAPKIRMKRNEIAGFLDEVPYLSDLQRTFYQTYIEARWEKLLLPAYELAAGEGDGGSGGCPSFRRK